MPFVIQQGGGHGDFSDWGACLVDAVLGHAAVVAAGVL